MEYEPDIKRHHHGDDRKDAKRLRGNENDHGETGLVAGHVAKSFFDSAHSFFFFLLGALQTRRQRKNGDNQSDKRDRIRKKRRGQAASRDQITTDGGSEHARPMKNRTID